MKTLYLHIGTMKTGTTAIQTFMERHGDFLKEQSCVYPMFPYEFKYKAHRRNGNFINATYTDKYGDSSNERNQAMVTDCLNTIVELFKTYDKVVLSDEVLFWNLGTCYKYRTERLLKCAKDNGFTIKIIIYLRKQYEILDAQWNQSIKQASGSADFSEFKERMLEKNRYDYYMHIDRIAGIFGKENIIVRRYQKSDLIEGSSVADFLHSIGIDALADIDTSFDGTNKNYRISNNMAFIKRQINEYSTASREESSISRSAMEKASISDSIHEYKSAMMSVEEKKQFMSLFEEGNKKIVDEYIKDGRALFDDKYEEVEKWDINNPAMIEDIIKSYSAMFGEVLGVLEKYKQKNKELEGRIKKLERGKIKPAIRKIIKGK